MRFLSALLLSVSAVYACGENAYRCKNPNVSVNEMWVVTHRICDKLGEDDCYCSHWAEYYCDPSGYNIQKFKDECLAQGEDWYWSEC